jgi:CRAL/TRIO domain.
MGQLAIINAPSSFTFIWSAIKPWLSKETAEKVDILGSDYKDVLLELVDADNLPSMLGGNCTCEDMGGCHLSGVGPWMDEREGWGPKAKEQRGNSTSHKGGGTDASTRSSETVVARESHVVPADGEAMIDLETREIVEDTEVNVGVKELQLEKAIDGDIRPALISLLPSLQDKEEGKNAKEDESLRAQEGLDENSIDSENAQVDVSVSKFTEQHLTNGVLADQHGAQLGTMN